MKAYEWVLFDADDTLFHFDAFRGLQLMFSRFNILFTAQDYVNYQQLNKALWVEYQKGQVTAQEIQRRRFHIWATKLEVSPYELNSAFMIAMAEISTPLAGATNLLDELQGKAKLGIITNGFVEIQQMRLDRTGFTQYFELVVISEEVGIAKPHPGIFEHAISRMNNPHREKILMVGDNLNSDILGGINAGLDTCWLNVDNKPTEKHITPHYQVSSFAELEKRLLPQY
jgi:putative hydrolase of the HAD superfamily/5'-nucleotidase